MTRKLLSWAQIL